MRMSQMAYIMGQMKFIQRDEYDIAIGEGWYQRSMSKYALARL